MHVSVKTIKDPEFINLKPLDINPLMSSCQIKVLYVGENRNRTFISKETALEMSKSLRGSPIVGWYKKDKEDFIDHGEKITINGEGVKFECKTRPYGFVAPDAQVWFQEFEDTDDFGNKITREYLMTTGYLWTGQFQEIQNAMEEGRPHSMELDEESLKGHWAIDPKTDMEFFIIDDATFSKLCILGNDVEPCFEGSSVTTAFTLSEHTIDEGFINSLNNMAKDLQFALKGGSMEGQTEFKKKKEEQKSEEEEKKNKMSSEEENNVPPQQDEEEEKKKKKKEEDNKYSLLEEKFNKLEQSYEALQTDYQALVKFKKQVEDKEKDDLIAQFYMLSDEDKKDVIANKDKYSLEDIEAKLSVICVRKKVDFNLDTNAESKEQQEEHDTPITTYSLNQGGEAVPAWIVACINTQKQRNI